MVDLTLSITTSNNKKMLSEMIDSIRERTKKISYELFVVVSGPDDGTIDYLKSLNPAPTIIFNDPFPGYSASHNMAIEQGNGRYLLILNDDMILLSDTFDEMVELMDADPEVGLGGCRLENEDGSLQYSAFSSYSGFLSDAVEALLIGAVARKLKLNIGIDYFGKYISKTDRPINAAHVMGAFMMLRREAMVRAGSMDEAFFMGFEDQDICKRVIQAGFDVRYYPAARMIHFGNRVVGGWSRKRAIANFYDGRLRLHSKFHGGLSTLALKTLMAFGFSVKMSAIALRALVKRSNPFENADAARAFYSLQYLFGRLERG